MRVQDNFLALRLFRTFFPSPCAIWGSCFQIVVCRLRQASKSSRAAVCASSGRNSGTVSGAVLESSLSRCTAPSLASQACLGRRKP